MKLKINEGIPKTNFHSLDKILSDRNNSLYFLFNTRYYFGNDYFESIGVDFSNVTSKYDNNSNPETDWDNYDVFVKYFDNVSDEDVKKSVLIAADIIRDNYNNGMSGNIPIKYRKIEGLLDNEAFIKNIVSDCIYSRRFDYIPMFRKNDRVDAVIDEFANKLANELYHD